jgi:hypothetical protein
MPNPIEFNYEPIVSNLLGMIDYYEIVFRDKELINKESEFRNHRLCLILELIDTIAIPEDLMTDLKSAIIAAWRLKVPGSTKEKRTIETGMVLRSLEQLRYDIKSEIEHPDPRLYCRLDANVLRSASLRRMDFESKKVKEVQGLLDQAMKNLETAILEYDMDLATA